MLDGKVMMIHLIVGLTKNIFLLKLSYFLPCGHSKNKLEVKLNFFEYANKT